MTDLKKVIIKMIVFDESTTIWNMTPIADGFAIGKGVEKEWFKQCARERFEKILNKWEEENDRSQMDQTIR